MKGFLQSIFSRFYEKENDTWKIRRLGEEAFASSAKQTSLLYCRLTDFMWQIPSMHISTYHLKFFNIWFILFCSRINLSNFISWDFFYFSSKWIDFSKNGCKCVVKIWKRYYIDKRFCGNSDQKLFPNAPKNVRSWETFTIKRGSQLYISNTLNTDYLLWHSKVQ